MSARSALTPAYAADPYASRVLDSASIVPRQDPVVHDHGRPGCPLTPEQVRTYDLRGFLVLRGLFSDPEVARLQEEAARFRSARYEIDPQTLVLEPDSREVRSIFRIHTASALFARLLGDERLLSIARWLLADHVYLHQSRLNFKPGFLGREFFWHSDFETWHMEDGMPRMRALSVSIALTENTEFNGPLMLVPGSHLRYVTCVGATPTDHYKRSLRRQEYGVPDRVSLEKLVEVGGLATSKGPPGTVTVFDCNLMHGSSGNITPFPRANAFAVYNAIANRLVAPFGGRPPRPEFIAARKAVRALEPSGSSLV